MKQLFFGFIIFSLLFTSCHKKKTTWNSDWSAPIVNDTLSLDKYVKNSTLSVSNSGFYELNYNRTILDFNLVDIVKIPDTTISKSLGIAFSNFTLEPGTSFVNSIEEHNMNVAGVELKKIRLAKGFLDITLKNPINTAVIFNMKLPGVSLNGIDYEKNYTVPAGTNANPGVIEATVDISGYEIVLTGVSGGGFNIIQSKYSVTTDPNGITTSMTDQDITKVLIKFRGLNIDYARGYFGDKIISDTTQSTIDILNNISGGTIDLPASKLKFTITNGMKIPAKTTLSLVKNINQNGTSVPLLVNSQSTIQLGESFNLDPATGSWSTLSNSKKVFEFNASNSNLEQYLENLGVTQEIGYSIQLNPWGNSSGGWNEIFPTSRLKVEVEASMPLTIGLNGLTLKNSFDFNLNQNTEKTHAVSGNLILQATNAFPMSGKITLDLLDIDGNVLFKVLGSEVFQSSLFGNTVSKNVKTCISTVHFILSKEIITKLDLIKKVSIISEFNTPEPTTLINGQVKIPEGAFLGVKLKGDFKIENRY